MADGIFTSPSNPAPTDDDLQQRIRALLVPILSHFLTDARAPSSGGSG